MACALTWANSGKEPEVAEPGQPDRGGFPAVAWWARACERSGGAGLAVRAAAVSTAAIASLAEARRISLGVILLGTVSAQS